MDVHRNEDDYYEDIIKKLYKPVVKKQPTMKNVITQPPLPFEVEPAPEPAPAVVPEPEPEEDTKPTILNRWKAWIDSFMKEDPNE